jgi:hypothetical protein
MTNIKFKVDEEIDVCKEICPTQLGSFRNYLRDTINQALDERGLSKEDIENIDIEKILEEASVQFTIHDIRFTIRVR